MPTAAITSSTFADGPRVVEKSRGTAHPSQGRATRRPAAAPAQQNARRHAVPARRSSAIY